MYNLPKIGDKFIIDGKVVTLTWVGEPGPGRPLRAKIEHYFYLYLGRLLEFFGRPIIR